MDETGTTPSGVRPPHLSRSRRLDLLMVLSESQRRGFLGPGPVEGQLDRAMEMGSGLPTTQAGTRVMDLGSGGGLPGLPLAVALVGTSWILLDSGVGRTTFLREAAEQLGITDRVLVVTERAETAGRGPLRSSIDIVVARSFGPPAVTAECAAPFLRTGGTLLVAEPPGDLVDGRWDIAGLARLGLRLGPRSKEGTAWQALIQESTCSDRYPRRTGVPAKRPLF